MSKADDWARDFYRGDFVGLWLSAIPEQQTRDEADFLEKSLQTSKGASIVDLACGGGRHCVELAARGYRMTGVDISAEFLAAAREAADRRGAQVTWEERSLQDLHWESAFDGAICMGNSLGGLDDAGMAAFLHSVARALRPAARFVLNIGTMAESLLPHLKERDWWPVDKLYFLASRQYDAAQGRLNVEYTFIKDGQVTRKPAFMQVYTYKEFCRIVQEAGFSDIQGYASPAQEPYQLGSPDLFLVAMKG